MKYIDKLITSWRVQSDPRFKEQLRLEAFATFRGGALMGAILFLPGIFLDWMVARPYFIPLTLVRILASIAFLGFYLLSKSKQAQKNPYLYCLFLIFTGSLSITVMCLIQNGYESPYYAGVCLVITAIGVVLPYNPLKTAFLVAVCFFTYLIPVLIQAEFKINDMPALINNLFFLSLTGIIATVASQLKSNMKYQIFTNLLRIEETNQKLKEYDQLKNQFFSNISHELRTPLSLILGAADRWKSQPATANENSKNFEIIRSNSFIVLKHVNDLLDMAKLEAGKMSLNLRPVDLAKLVRRISEMFKTLTDQKKIEFNIETPETLIASVDIEKFEKILSNLLSNAFKFVSKNPKVKCSLKTDNGYIELRVEDNGLGIQNDQKEKVFERFYQTDSGDARSHGGTGLGLSIVKEFTQLHEGNIQFVDNIDGGAIAIVRLPLVEGSNLQNIQRIEDLQFSTEQTLIAEISNHKIKPLKFISENRKKVEVFIIEDNYEMRIFLEDSLKPHFGIASFSNAKEALNAVYTMRPELILTDFMMPNMNGKDLFERLKSDSNFSDIPLIFLTAKADEKMRLQMIESGAFDYLIKPFSVPELLARLRNCLIISRSKKRLQKELNSSQSDIQILTGEVLTQKHKLELAVKSATVARDDAIESSKVKSRFLRLISHELRTPLSTIKMISEFLHHDGLEGNKEKNKELLESLIRSANSLRDLVETLLQYSKIQKGKFSPKKDLFDLSNTIEEVLNNYRPLAEGKNLQVFSSVPKNIKIHGDAEIVSLIVSNLISNAIKYTDMGSISIEVIPSLEKLKIYVKDTGIGIEKADIERIFDEFERIPGTGPFVPGFGLGLSLVKYLITAIGGEITAKSVVGRGSAFEIQFPQQSDEFLFNPKATGHIIESRI